MFTGLLGWSLVKVGVSIHLSLPVLLTLLLEFQ